MIRRLLRWFTLSFLAVLAVAALVIALKVPIVFSNPYVMLAREQTAVREICTLQQAAIAYHARFGHCAQSIAELGLPAKEHKGGYIFTITSTPECYTITGVPETYLSTGSRTFLSDQSMTIHQNYSLEPATAASPELR